MSANPELVSLLASLRSLEARIARMEERLNLEPVSVYSEERAELEERMAREKEEALELNIGRDWFAKLGIVILALGVVFLLTLPYAGLPAVVPSLLGCVIAGSIIVLGQRQYEATRHLAGYLLGGGIILLYFTTLRLSFFSPTPAVTHRTVEVLFLGLAVATGLLISTRNRSASLTGLALALGYATAVVADDPLTLFLALTGLSILAVILALKNGWYGILAAAAALNVLTHLVWFLNSPILGREVALASSPHMNIYFVLLNILIIGLGTAWKPWTAESKPIVVTSVFNGVGGYLLFLYVTSAKFNEGYVVSHVLAHVVLLALATLFWVRHKSKFSTFYYAMLGYMALSVAITAASAAPEYFVWLSWQSILVLSTAVWFRSRFIVVANFFIYLILFLAYLILAGKVSVVSLSFGVVALLSARILNSQRHRLELRTEIMRNAYLGSAFFVFPYALYHSVPSAFVSLSWLAVALFYYMMARALNNNRKYRWMSLLTLILTIGYVLIVDITALEPVFRVISFIVLGIVLLMVSIGYARRRERAARQQHHEVHAASASPTSVPETHSTDSQ